MTKFYILLATISTLVLFSFLTFNHQEQESDEKDAYPGVVTEYKDLSALGVHQVALEDLYVEIPYKKEDVDIRKRTTEQWVFIDILDQETGEVLYTYGESLGQNWEQSIFREVKTATTTVRIHALIEIDSSQGVVAEVNRTMAFFNPQPNEILIEMISAGSRSGEFPAENVEVLANLDFAWGTNQIETIYEGYEFGVINLSWLEDS